MAVLSVFAGCQKNEPQAESQKQQPESYLNLVKACEEGKIFTSVDVASASKKTVRFDDGTSIDVNADDFEIFDCTEMSPLQVQAEGEYWTVGSIKLSVKVETSLQNKDASPVYVYYDYISIHMYLSNGVHLVSQKNWPERKNIPVIRIFTDGSASINDKKNYVSGSITVSDLEGLYTEEKVKNMRMGIRGRGNSTWSFPKKPWKVKLESKAELLGMPADKEWALLANYADRTLVRNIVAMKLSEICGFSWTPRMRSVEVYLNGEYQGVYTLCEHKKVSKDRVNIDLVSEDDNDGDAVTGGYYLEIEQQQDETTCWLTSMEVPMMFSDPEEPTAQQYEYIRNLFDSFETALRNNDWSEETGYPKYIDVDSFINYYIVQELVKNIDGNLRKSSFITKERGKKMEMYHLWDFDLTLGNCGYFEAGVGNGPENFWIKQYKWYPYLFADPAFVEKLKNRWNELMPELEKIPDFIDAQVYALGDAVDRNFQRWSINESVDWVQFPSRGSYKKEVAYLKKFYSGRLKWLNTELNRL